jgi:hypothetical protein
MGRSNEGMTGREMTELVSYLLLQEGVLWGGGRRCGDRLPRLLGCTSRSPPPPIVGNSKHHELAPVPRGRPPCPSRSFYATL